LGAVLFTLKLRAMAASALGVLAAISAASVVAFRAYGVLMDLVPTFGAVGLLLGIALAYGLVQKAAEARRWVGAVEVLRTTGLDPSGPPAAPGALAQADQLGLAGSLAAALRVPDTTPATILQVMSDVLGARQAFIRFEGRDGQTQWLAVAREAPEAQRARELAEALAARDGSSLIVPRVKRDRFLRPFADLADSALALRLTLGERRLATVVLCGKTPTPISPSRQFGPDDLRIALALAPQASLLLDHARLHRGLYTALRDAVATLASAVGARDEYTSGHSARVARYAACLARAMELPDWCVEAVELGALLHDIGKIGMDEVILRSSAVLTDADRDLVHQHPDTGAGIFSHMDELSALLPAIRHHHERHDGRGYPDGLAGAEIPLLARIVCVADSFDAMTFRRPYRDRALSVEEACEELRQNAGTQFDPELVRLFVEHVTPELVEEARRGGLAYADSLAACRPEMADLVAATHALVR